MARTIKKYHAQAFANRVKIVHMCGFDSIPSDLGAHLVATTIEKQYHRCWPITLSADLQSLYFRTMLGQCRSNEHQVILLH